jgi:uncharacterized protein YjlB
MKRVNTNPEIQPVSLKKNKFFPNNELPVLIYRQAIEVPKQKNAAAGIIQQIFIKNKWSNSWRNGIYNFHHYHSNTHEVLGICSGKASVILGGPGKRSIAVNPGDVMIIPAGVAHKCVRASEDFLCVGGYPGGSDFDIHHGTEEEFEQAVARIKKLSVPSKDPVFGNEGFIKAYWQKTKTPPTVTN